MPRTRRTAKRRRKVGLEVWELAFARDELHDLSDLPEGANAFRVLGLRCPGDSNADERRDLWERARNAVMSSWIQERPGTRPSLWWQFDAPETVLISTDGLVDVNAQAIQLELHGLLTSKEREALDAA